MRFFFGESEQVSVGANEELERGMIFTNVCKTPVNDQCWQPVCLMLLLILNVSVGVSMADNNPVGTWEGVDETGDVINLILYNDGTIEGMWEDDLSPECVIYWDISGTYNFNFVTGHLEFCFDDRKPCANGIELRVVVCVDGYITICDSASGTSSGTGYVYYNGDLVDVVPFEELTWEVYRTSIPPKATNLSPGNGDTNQSVMVDLNWANGGGACIFDVYFGTTNPPTELIYLDVNESTCDPGPLLCEETYYWRVNSKNTNGTAIGDVWSFETGFPDLSGDGKIYFEDISILMQNWLNDTCAKPNWCEGADLNHSNTVDFFDFAFLAKHWCSDM